MNKKKKQVIVIMTDTQRKDMLSCYNPSKNMYTENLDKLSQNGIRFENGYCAQPVCGPARSALFTGQYPHTNGSFANSMALSQLTKTIGERLTLEGKSTAFIGKWHLDGGDYFGDGICPKGWDKEYWFDMRNYLDGMSEEDRVKSREYSTVFEEDVPAEFTFANQCSSKAIDYITKHQEEDFLLVVSYDEPHHPFICPQKYYDLFKDDFDISSENHNDDLLDKPEHIQVWSKQYMEKKEVVDQNQWGLFATNAFVDDEIGRVLQATKEMDEEPLIIYTSDHGDMLGSHGIVNKGPAMFDEITNIPFIISGKGISGDIISHHPVSHVDIVPTILDYMGISIPRSMEGHSLLKTLYNPNIRTNKNVFVEFTRYEVDHDGFGGFQPIRCIVNENYKLNINLLTKDEMYDLKNDPYEMINLIENSDYEHERDQMHDQLLDWMNQTRDPFRGYYWERRPWRKNANEASWDYTGYTRQRFTEDNEVKQLDYSTGLEITDFIRSKEQN